LGRASGASVASSPSPRFALAQIARNSTQTLTHTATAIPMINTTLTMIPAPMLD